MARLSTPTAPVVDSINDSTPLVLSPELGRSLSSRDGALDAASDADNARRTPVVEFGRRVENLGALMANADDDEQEPRRESGGGGGGSDFKHGIEDEGHADEVVAMSKTLNAKMMKALNADDAGKVPKYQASRLKFQWKLDF